MKESTFAAIKILNLTCKVILEESEGVAGLVGFLVERDQGLGERLEHALLLEVLPVRLGVLVGDGGGVLVGGRHGG